MIDKRLTSLAEMANRFHECGAVDKLTMRKIDALAISAKQDEMTPDKIKLIREKEHISQAVLAVVLNMSSESVQKWEQGKTKPQGAALRLLHVIDKKGIQAII